MKSNKIRASAKGENCTVNIVGVCDYNDTTTVLAHLPDESGGMAHKPDDISACYACHDCHNMIDRRTKESDDFRANREWYLRRAMTRTWRRLIEKELIKVAY